MAEDWHRCDDSSPPRLEHTPCHRAQSTLCVRRWAKAPLHPALATCSPQHAKVAFLPADCYVLVWPHCANQRCDGGVDGARSVYSRSILEESLQQVYHPGGSNIQQVYDRGASTAGLSSLPSSAAGPGAVPNCVSAADLMLGISCLVCIYWAVIAGFVTALDTSIVASRRRRGLVKLLPSSPMHACKGARWPFLPRANDCLDSGSEITLIAWATRRETRLSPLGSCRFVRVPHLVPRPGAHAGPAHLVHADGPRARAVHPNHSQAVL